MPREIYYQDVGNPIQTARLPLTRPSIALAVPPVGPLAAKRIGCLLFAVQVAAGLLAPLEIPSWTSWWLPCYLCLGLALAYIVSTNWRPWRNLTAPLAAYAACGVLLFVPLNMHSQLGLTTVVVSLFAWQFGQHWMAVCTASPVERNLARQLMASWQIPLACLASVPVALAILAVEFRWGWWAWCILGVLCTVHWLWPKPTGTPWKLQVLLSSLVCWCTYDQRDLALPGLLRTPVGGWLARITITCAMVALVSSTWARYDSVQPVSLRDAWQIEHQVVAGSRVGPSEMHTTPSSLSVSVAWFAAVNGLQVAATVGLPVLLILPVLMDASRWRHTEVQESSWHRLIHELQHSPDPIESQSYFMGRVVQDGSPLIVPRPVFCEHAHFPGDAGSGKTALGLAPWIEQTVLFGDCSLIVVDLKADTLELWATLIAARQRLYERTGQRLPLKHLTNQSHLSTYAFNPLTQPYWADFDPYIKTDILCGAAGLLYGSDYGAGWYSSANAAVLHYAIKAFPNVSTLRELAQRVNETLLTTKRRDLHPELRNAGVHVQAILDRLGSFDVLNVAPQAGHSDEVLRQAIDLADVFRRPQLLYVHLSSSLAPGSSPEMARLLVYSLLCAASQTERRHQVFLVIDEFQRMVAHNVEYMLQLARSMGVGVILANQSLQDLGDLIPAVEANCRYRQWFSVSSLDDRERLIGSSGETVEQFVSKTKRTDGFWSLNESTTVSEQVMRRLSHNDVALASDHPLRSIVRIARGDGYAQYGGLPFEVESVYHISREEYDRRKAMRWPDPEPGTFVPKQYRQQTAVGPANPVPGPIVITEIIGDLPPGGPPPLPLPGQEPGRKPRKRKPK